MGGMQIFSGFSRVSHDGLDHEAHRHSKSLVAEVENLRGLVSKTNPGDGVQFINVAVENEPSYQLALYPVTEKKVRFEDQTAPVGDTTKIILSNGEGEFLLQFEYDPRAFLCSPLNGEPLPVVNVRQSNGYPLVQYEATPVCRDIAGWLATVCEHYHEAQKPAAEASAAPIPVPV